MTLIPFFYLNEWWLFEKHPAFLLFEGELGHLKAQRLLPRSLSKSSRVDGSAKKEQLQGYP